MNSIKFVNNGLGYAVGNCGTILKTTNGGSTWTNLKSNTSSDLNDVFFINSDTGYTVGYPSFIAKTVNGGLNWTALNFNVPNSILYSVSFINANTGIVTINGVVIYKTTNGGQSWYYYATGMSSGEIHSVQMLDQSNVFASGFNNILKSTNGGINWTKYSPGLFDYYQVFFKTLQSGIVVGTGGSVHVTTDAGNSWINKSLNVELNIRSVYTVNQGLSFFCGDTINGAHGVFYKTTNGGDNWSKIRIPTLDSTAVLNKVSFCGNDTGIIVGNSGVTGMTTNGGNNWQMISHGSIGHIEDIQILDTTFGFAIGNHLALKSTNGGNSWFPVTNPSSVCRALYFINENTGYIGGYDRMQRTTNGGINWITYNLASGSVIFDLYFHNALTGFGVGGNGMILNTTNGGVNWITKSTPTSNAMYEVCFANNLTGYTAGYNGTVLKTTDGGNSWVIVRNVAGQHLYAMDIINHDTLIAAGKSGIIIKSTNGGSNWAAIVSGTTKDLNAIKYFGLNGCIAAGNEGSVVFSTNRGESWILQAQVTKNNLFSICVQDTNIYMSGLYGTILCSSPSHIITNIKSQSSSTVREFVLHQNYPNPFNPVTKIKFDVPSLGLIHNGEKSSVRLDIYDILGREVTTLVNEKLSSGTYEVEWDASGYPSGIYFYRLSASDLSYTRKMILIK